MCDFCENLNDDNNYETPHLMYGNYCKNDNHMFYIDVPTDDGLSYTVDNILYCPMCGRNLKGVQE